MLASSKGLGHLARCLELARYLRKHGDEVFFGCGHGSWRWLVQAYGFEAEWVYEPLVRDFGSSAVMLPDCRELINSYQSDIAAIRRTRPDVVLSDWRFSAGLSTAAMDTPLLSIWNSNWGALAGFPSFVDEMSLPVYRRIQIAWKMEVTSFIRAVQVSGWRHKLCLLRGEVNVVADHPAFRGRENTRTPPSTLWSGPLVPWPRVMPPKTHLKPRGVHLAFGGHRLSALQRNLADLCGRLGVPCTMASWARQRVRRQIAEFFPQDLWEAEVVITHGGAGSIYQALLVGKPIIVIPQHVEHRENARCLEALGLGVGIDECSLGPSALSAALATVMEAKVLALASKFGALLRQSKPFERTRTALAEISR